MIVAHPSIFLYISFFIKAANTSHDFMFTDVAADLAGSFGLIISIVGVVFNLLNILALLNYKPIRAHVTTPFVISLSTSDMLFSGLVLPILSIRFISRYTHHLSKQKQLFNHIIKMI